MPFKIIAEELRESVFGGPLPSPRLVSLLVHGSRESDSPVTLMLAQWGQFIDHDLTATLQPRYVTNIHNLKVFRCFLHLFECANNFPNQKNVGEYNFR